MQVQGDSQIRVYQGLLNHDPYLLPSVNGVYSLVVGQYFCIELLVNQRPQSATWKGDHLDIVKEYAVSVQKARLIPCDQEVQTTLFTGVWWRSGAKLLSVSSGTQQFSLHFTVSTPLLQPVFTEVTIGQPTVGRFSIPLDKTPRTWLVLAGPVGQLNRQLHGFTLTYGVEPFLAGGTIACIQLIQTTRNYQQSDGRRRRRASNGAVLDNGRNPTSYLYSNQVLLTPQQDALVSLNDGPALDLEAPLLSASVNEQFRTFLMFRPAGDLDKTTWVPLSVVSWNWSATASVQAVQEGNIWLLPSAQRDAGNPVECATLALQDAFPCWEATVNLLQDQIE